MFCKTRDEKILDMCTRKQITMLEDHFGLKGRYDKVEERREALRTWLREQKAEEKEAECQCEEEEIQCQQEGAEALPQNEEPHGLEEISDSRESSLERHEVEPKLEPGDNEVQLQREERQARLEQEKAKAEQERAKAEQEKAKAEQEKAKAEQEKLKVGQERAKAEQETAKAELAMIKMEAAKADQERIKMARRENRVKNEGKSVVTLAMCDPRSKYTNVFHDKPQTVNLVNERKRGEEIVKKSNCRENERRRDSMCGETLMSSLGEVERHVRSSVVECSTVLEETFRERRRVEGEERELFVFGEEVAENFEASTDEVVDKTPR
ncbi:uncharacterized protein [Procambarus clarkii]|uniref:uncharacterized protein n=1 Tax=Procambarus clarkii TaxID=6728 RepID=UPI003743A6C6